MFDEKQVIDESNSVANEIVQDFEIIYRQLIKQFNNAHVIPIRDAGALIGYTRSTSATLAPKKLFPIPSIRIGKKHYILTLVMARFLADPAKMSAVPPILCPGRPKKGTGPKELAAAAAKKMESQK